jgi:protoporphyrinogen/coproporphyrinogen III oxidase
LSETSTANRQEKVVVIGGGISGLASAFYLSKKGFRPTLIEKTGSLGGLIRTESIGGCELEAGPDSFIAAKPAVAELAAELGITDQIIGSNDERRRIFIERRGKLIPFPAGMAMMVPGDLGAALRAKLFSARTKAGFFRELLSLPRTRMADVSIHDFVRDHFSDEMLAYVAEPLLSGVYGGDPGRLSAASVLPRFVEYERKYGSLIRGVRRERAKAVQHKGSLFLSFRGGMQTLVDALVRAINGRVEIKQAEVQAVEKTATGWNVCAGEQSFAADHVVLACPAHVNSALLKAADPELAGTLAEIPYSSAILVTLVYDRDQLGHSLDGFGFLVPRGERKSVAAATWVSTKFPSRTPKNRAALRAFIVGEEAVRLMNTSDSGLVEIAGEEFQRVMGIEAAPLFSKVHRWPDSMPQYVVGHEKWKNAVVRQVSRNSGLHVCGNAYDGVGIPDCVRLARETADRVSAKLKGLT